MPIITLNEVKSLLQLTTTDATRDALITSLIPFVQKNVIRYCKNSFLNQQIVLVSSAFAFTIEGSGTLVYKITDENSRFTDYKFIAGDYKVSGSLLNDGIYQVTNVAADALTVTEVLKAEAAGEDIQITKVEFPDDIKIPVSQYISWLITKQGKSVKSESLPGGYSVTFKDEQEVMKSFNQFRKPFL